MAEMTIRKTKGIWVVRAGGAILGESAAVMELTEGDHPPVIYFPRAHIAMAFLEPSDHTTICPRKGKASYYSIITKSRTIENAAWSFEDPLQDAMAIKDHVAFLPCDLVTVEQI